MTETSDRIAALRLAARGDVSGAVAHLRSVADTSNDPEDRFVLGKMCFLVTDFEGAREQLERAYRDFRTRGDRRRAAMVAAFVGRIHFDMLDDKVVGRAWLARALRLLEPEEACVERGYVLVGLFGVTVESADELEASARSALEIARQFHDPNLECKALADSGLALVSMGRVRDGMSRLDEAFTMIAGGESTDPSVINQVACGLISACDRAGDVGRAEAWLRYIEKKTPAEGDGPAVHTFAHCWCALGSVLCQAGRWQEGERALRMALARGDASYLYVKLTTRATLAELWIRQGRLDEAALLIDENAERVEIMMPRARLYLAQGRCDLAAAVARQALRQLAGDRLRAAHVLLLLVEAELACGRTAAAEAAAGRLQALSEDVDVPAVAAQAALALGKAAIARGESGQAVDHFEAGLRAVGDGWPLLRAALHLELALATERDAEAEMIVNAEMALSIYGRLGAVEATTAAELLRAHGRPTTIARRPPGALDLLSRREREVLALLAEGLSNPAIASRLFITPKTAEHHVSSILGKLGLHNRAEAAAYAASFRFTG